MSNFLILPQLLRVVWLGNTVVDLMNWPYIDLLDCQESALYNVIILQKEKVPENPPASSIL